MTDHISRTAAATAAAHRFACSGTPVLTHVYIAGPMTDLPDFNYPAFNAAAAILRRAGHFVENPAENDPPNADPTWADWMRLALTQMLRCQAVLLLDGWQGSRGAVIEARMATALGLTVIEGATGKAPHIEGIADQAWRDTEIGALIADRDRCEDWADRLADVIASYTGADIGEHTSANNPWANAIEALEAAESADEQSIAAATEEMQRQYELDLGTLQEDHDRLRAAWADVINALHQADPHLFADPTSTAVEAATSSIWRLKAKLGAMAQEQES